MFGLLIGSWWVGNQIQQKKIKNELKAYALLELVIGISGLLLLYVLPNSKAAFALFGEPTIDFNTIRLVCNIILTVILLIVPTAAMGATLPLLVGYFSKKERKFRKITAQFYSINALGGAIASLITGFFLIKYFGVNQSILLAVGLNIIIGIVAFGLSTNDKTEDISPKEQLDEKYKIPHNTKGYYLTAAFLTGFLSIAYEVLWIRCLSYLLNSSTYTFSIVLGIFLFGIAVGSLIVSILKKVASIQLLTGLVQFFLALLSIGVIYLFYEYAYSESFAELFIISNGLESNWYENVGLNLVFAIIVFLVPAVLMGMSFPLISELYFRSKKIVPGAAISKVYVINTLGCILGALLPVFVLIPLLGGIKSTLFTLSGINFLLAIYFVINAQNKMKLGIASILVISFSIAAFSLQSGDFLASLESIGEDRKEDKPLFYKEGIMATVKVYNKEGRYKSMSIDGVTIASENFKQKESIIGHLPFFTNAVIDKVLVVGLASGSTIGSILKHSEIKNIDVVEIVPSVLQAAQFFNQVNGDVLNQDKVDIYVDDIYSYLSYTDKKYDLISSDGKFGVLNKSNTTMLSQDYYEECYDHLSDSGIFVQWLSTQIPNEHLKTALATTASVFEHSELFLLRKNLFILSSKKPMPMEANKILDALDTEAITSDMYQSEIYSEKEMLTAYIGPNTTMGSINSFNNPRMEYDFIREWKRDKAEDRSSGYKNFKYLHTQFNANKNQIKSTTNTITNNAEFVTFELNNDFWKSRNYSFKANHALLDGNKKNAYTNFKEIIKINHPANDNDIAVAAKQIGVFNLDTKRYSDALNYFEIATQKMPSYSAAHALTGVSLYYLEKKDSARISFEKALSLNPNDQTAKQFLNTY